MNTEKEPQAEQEQEEYEGNIWGWRFSLMGLALIVLLGGFMVYRHKTMKVPMNGWNPKEEQTISSPQDSSGR